MGLFKKWQQKYRRWNLMFGNVLKVQRSTCKYFQCEPAIKGSIWPTHGPHQLSTTDSREYCKSSQHMARTNLSPKFYIVAPAMKVMSAFTLVFAASILQTVTAGTGFKCDTHCAACWKKGEPGVDIKMSCDADSVCGGITDCPPGYEDIHCAKLGRCLWVWNLKLYRMDY